MNIKGKIKKYLPDSIIRYYHRISLERKICRHKKEVAKREKMSIFDYYELSADMPYVTREKFQNGFYGLDKIIKKYERIDKNTVLDGYIEHGLYYDNSIEPIEISGNNLWTLGEERREYLGQYMDISKVHSIGPYIIYADDLYSEITLAEMRKGLGKTLLVFPTHSTHWNDTSFDISEFIKEIKRIKEEYAFETVLVSIYWKDVLRGMAEKYEESGFKVCTSGHIFDDNFMSRQKSIIKLADMCMGNGIGTQIGYCIALGKSYYYYPMKIVVRKGIEYDYDLHEDVDYKSKLEKLLEHNFGTYHEEITKDNISFIKRYWGDF